MKLKILIDESIITTEFFRLLSEYSQRKVSIHVFITIEQPKLIRNIRV